MQVLVGCYLYKYISSALGTYVRSKALRYVLDWLTEPDLDVRSTGIKYGVSRRKYEIYLFPFTYSVIIKNKLLSLLATCYYDDTIIRYLLGTECS
jgi:hypothetical protein